MNVPRPNGNGRSQAHAGGLGGALAIIVIAGLANGLNWRVDPLTAAAVATVMGYAAAWFPKPPHK